MRDRASVNGAALRLIKGICSEIQDHGCLAHLLDEVGNKIQVPAASKFLSSFWGIFSKSQKAKILWREQTKISFPGYSETRWWSK